VRGSLTRASDGLEVHATLACAELMGTLPAVPRSGSYQLQAALVKEDGTVIATYEDTVTFDVCDTTIVTGDGTLCGVELAPHDFDVP
jgi:hypothetical protein